MVMINAGGENSEVIHYLIFFGLKIFSEIEPVCLDGDTETYS